ncbi:MAG: metallophosphoesterase family protein [Clostridia bacterium]|nr:metallophosphoesterase family protein [Clostridia bacterium]
MRTLILSDIHGNLAALEAVLDTREARSCERIISLGDHVNFCPQSREVHDRLVSLGAVMLLGNHEERLTRPSDAEFNGYNWSLLRWTAERMQGADLSLPTDLIEGPILYTHGTAGDPYHLVQVDELPGVLSALPEGVTLMLSGHNHHRWDVESGGHRAFNPGSVGMAEDGMGGMASFAVLEGERAVHHQVPYDVEATIRAYLTTGAYRAAPEMCRACVRVLQTAEYQGVLNVVRHVIATGRTMGLTLADHAAWQSADRTYPWAEEMSSTEYWKHMEDVYL